MASIITEQINTERIDLCVKLDCCKAIKVVDCTEWESVELSDTYGTVIVTLPNNEEFSFDVTAAIQNEPEECFELTKLLPQDFNLESLLDGLYKIQYIAVYDNTITYVSEKLLYNYCNVKCCVDKMTAKSLADYLNNCNPCNPCDDFLNVIIAQQLLKALENSVAMYDFVQADKFREKLENICKLNKCNC